MRYRPTIATAAALALVLAACGGQEPGGAEAFAQAADSLEATDRQPSNVLSAEDATAVEGTTTAAADDESREVAPSESPSVVLAEAGTEIRIALDEAISTETHEAGETFTARVVNDVSGPQGIALPAGTLVHGLVRASRESGSSEEPATLVLAIEGVTVDGKRLPLEGSVSDTNIESDRRDSTGQTVGKIAIGTAAGAILGGILGDGDRGDAVRGAIAGAAGGAIVAFTTRDGHASVDEGSVLVVTLESALIS